MRMEGKVQRGAERNPLRVVGLKTSQATIKVRSFS